MQPAAGCVCEAHVSKRTESPLQVTNTNLFSSENTVLTVIDTIEVWSGHSQIPESCVLEFDFSYYSFRTLVHSAVNPAQSNFEERVVYNLNPHLWAASTHDK